MNNKIELAWAAGFYDGEGSTKRVYYHYKTKNGIKRIPNKHISMTVSQCELFPLKRFMKAVGNLGRINGPYKYKAQKRPYWIWSVTCHPAMDVFKKLKPYLSPIKIKQFNTVMKDVKPTPNRKKAWIYDKK